MGLRSHSGDYTYTLQLCEKFTDVRLSCRFSENTQGFDKGGLMGKKTP